MGLQPLSVRNDELHLVLSDKIPVTLAKISCETMEVVQNPDIRHGLPDVLSILCLDTLLKSGTIF